MKYEKQIVRGISLISYVFLCFFFREQEEGNKVVNELSLNLVRVR